MKTRNIPKGELLMLNIFIFYKMNKFLPINIIIDKIYMLRYILLRKIENIQSFAKFLLSDKLLKLNSSMED